MIMTLLEIDITGTDLCKCADNCNYNSSGVVLNVGGNYNQNQNYGLFYLNGNNSASNTNSNLGARHLVNV